MSLRIVSALFAYRTFSTAHAVVSSAIAFYLLYISDVFIESAPYGPIMFRSSMISQIGLGVGFQSSILSQISHSKDKVCGGVLYWSFLLIIRFFPLRLSQSFRGFNELLCPAWTVLLRIFYRGHGDCNCFFSGSRRLWICEPLLPYSHSFCFLFR